MQRAVIVLELQVPGARLVGFEDETTHTLVYLSELACLDRAFRRLGEQALGDETALLSPDAVGDLAAELERLDDLVTLDNAAVWDTPPKLKRPELRAKALAELEPVLAEATEQQKAYLKDRAKAEVLRLMGEDNAAADLVGRHVP